MTIKSIQLLVLGFPQPTFDGEVVDESVRLRESDLVRVVDAVAVVRAVDGTVTTVAGNQLTWEELREFGSVVDARCRLRPQP